ncbi:MAG: HAD family hydrolase [Promethearchaeota archaeon]
MNFKAIIFDLGGVIIEFDYTRFFNDVILLSPLHKPNSLLLLEFWRQSDLYHQGKISNEEFYHQTCELLQICALTQEEFFDSFNSVLAKRNEEVIEIIRKIRYMNKYKLILLSNINASHWEYLLNEKWGFIEYFDEFILSHEVKMSKPDPRIFELAIKKAGCKPQEIVYIDDGLNNIKTAEEMGIVGIKYNNPKELEAEFRRLKILLH